MDLTRYEYDRLTSLADTLEATARELRELLSKADEPVALEPLVHYAAGDDSMTECGLRCDRSPLTSAFTARVTCLRCAERLEAAGLRRKP